MDAIVQSERGLISSTNAVNLPTSTRSEADKVNLSASACEKICKTLVQDQWLMQVPDFVKIPV